MRSLWLPLALLTACLGAAASAAPHQNPAASAAALSRTRVWTIHVDNDLFAFGDRDRDYTGGVAFTLTDDAAASHALSLSGALARADRVSRFGTLLRKGEPRREALEIGLLLFTPHDLEAQRPLYDDRPYANLLYVSSSQLTHDAGAEAAYQSSLTLGVLGLPLAERLHGAIHDVFGSEDPMGYDHQVSDGGEPTLRYAVSRSRLLASGTYGARPYTLRFGMNASVGYLTEGGAEIAARWGRASMPWWASLPVASDYAGQPSIAALRSPARAGRAALLFESGIKIRARLYNSFLQGQLRHSDVTFSSSELEHWLFEAWIGATAVLRNGVTISYTIRRQTDEIAVGAGSRDFTWASIGVAQSF